jgi:hypothetical protein
MHAMQMQIIGSVRFCVFSLTERNKTTFILIFMFFALICFAW